MKIESQIKTKKDFLDTFIDIYIQIATINTLSLSNKSNNEKNPHVRNMKIAENGIKSILNYKTINDDKNIDNKVFDILFYIIDDKFSQNNARIDSFDNNTKKNIQISFDLYKKIKNMFVDKFGNKNILLKMINEYIKEKGIIIHEDKDKQIPYNYGNLVQIDKGIDEKIYRFDRFAIREVKRYQTRRSNIANGKNEFFTDQVNLSRIRITTEIEPGKVEAIECYCDTELLDYFRNGENYYILRFLAAVAKAKNEIKEYIGTITMIDEELQTFIITYDDKLELALKKMEISKTNQINPSKPLVNEQNQY